MLKRFLNVSSTSETRTEFDLISSTSVNLLRMIIRECKCSQWRSTVTNLKDGDPAPLGSHWLLFRDGLPSSSLCKDGYKRFCLKDNELFRRVLSGGSFRYYDNHPLLVGRKVARRSQWELLANVGDKKNKIVKETRSIYSGKKLSIIDEQYITHLDTPYLRKEGPKRSINYSGLSHVGTIENIDSISLFQFSALIFNAHRIHWDIEYARNYENYDDLVVPGQLIALLALNIALESSRFCPSAILSIDYRLLDIVYCNKSLSFFEKKPSASCNSFTRRILVLCQDSLVAMINIHFDEERLTTGK